MHGDAAELVLFIPFYCYIEIEEEVGATSAILTES